jgi:hypothetical protein
VSRFYGWPWLAVLALLVLTPGCGRSVTVQPPADAADSPGCQSLKDDLPDTVAGEHRLAIAPPSPHTAAWGSPAVVWRCGVRVPTALAADSQLIVVDETEWLPESLEAGVRFTSLNKSPRIELTVPAIYPDPAGLLTTLT